MSIEVNRSALTTPSQYLELIATQVASFPIDKLNDAISVLQKAHQDDKTVFLVANGGSAGFLSHWEVDWIKGVFLATNKSLNTVSIPGQVGLFSAASNDFGWNVAFKEILRMRAKKDDILVAVSSSGESQNVINATKFAIEVGFKTISLSGFGDTTLSGISEVPIALDSTDMQVIEDCHHLFGHIVLKSFGGRCQE